MTGENDRFEAIKRRYRAPELVELAVAEGLHSRVSGRNRCTCPGCRNADPRGASIGETDGIGVWNCHRDERHRGTAIDFRCFARSLTLLDAVVELERLAGEQHTTPAAGSSTPERRPPPVNEVEELWARCVPITRDQVIASAWSARGIDVAHVEDRELARVLPAGFTVPRWAWGAGRAWSSGEHRLMVPLHDAQGRLRSLHARAAVAPYGTPKGLSPARFSVAGLVTADPLARLLLAGANCGDGEPACDVVRRCDLLVTEGPPDFLTWATRWGDAAEQAPAIIGIVSGSWTETIAERVPSGAHVVVREHPDSAGGKYTSRITASLRARCGISVTVAEGAES